MAHIITVTIAGGAYNGPEKDTKISINADKISSIKETDKEDSEVGNSIITLTDKTRHNVTETREELERLINGK